MGGLFGGLLSVFHGLGVLFFTLLIGPKRAERLRLLAAVAGGIIIFGGLGGLLSIINPEMFAGPRYTAEPISAGQTFFVGVSLGALIGCVVAAALFGLASYIEEQEAQEQREKERLAEEERKRLETEARREEYKNDLIAKGMDHLEAQRRAERDIKLPGQGGCFIATAVYDSGEAPEVLLLRQWRDEVLLRSVFGRVFIRIYYSSSPLLANSINHHAKLKKPLKVLIGLLVNRIVARK